ncbi:MAG: apolipoprotein N-acyltransferase [Rhizobiaceae bacterium]|nr:apolipoprotein N-acyltransferase [Rhizobiaceae bacterium]
MEKLAGNIALLTDGKRTLAALLAGAFAVLIQAPFDFIFAGFVSFPILVWLLDGAAPSVSAGLLGKFKPAFVTGWWFGFGYFLAGMWWVGSALTVESQTYAWALPFAIVGLPLVLALYFGLATALARLLWSDGIGRIAALGAAFALAEWLRGTLLTGFPWNPIGFGLMPVPVLMQSVGIVSDIGMNALAVFVFAMPALLGGKRHRASGIALAAVLLAAHVAYGFKSLSTPEPTGSTLNVRIVQPNIDLTEKWDSSVRDRIFNTEIGLSQRPPEKGKAKPTLIIWPETSIPFIFQDYPEGLRRMGDMLGEGQLLLAGVARTEGTGDSTLYYNSIVAIDGKGEVINAFDKVHLVPFGEYMPFEWVFEKLGINQFVAGPMNFIPGARRNPMPVPGNFAALPYICYEIIFPNLMFNEAPESSFILNVTNDAWFGNTPGPYQHLRQAQIRAVESGLPLVRAANTGISAVIDPKGRVLDALAINMQGYIDATITVSPQAYSAPFPNRTLNGIAVTLALALLAVIMSLYRKFRI